MVLGIFFAKKDLQAIIAYRTQVCVMVMFKKLARSKAINIVLYII